MPFQFLYGTIKIKNTKMKKRFILSFQFLYGTIKITLGLTPPRVIFWGFNSYMVRLKYNWDGDKDPFLQGFNSYMVRLKSDNA